MYISYIVQEVVVKNKESKLQKNTEVQTLVRHALCSSDF
jgi:hypothetical protein